jgi:hypothetical protein
LADDSDTERLNLHASSPLILQWFAAGQNICVEAWYYVPQPLTHTLSAVGLSTGYSSCALIQADGTVELSGIAGGGPYEVGQWLCLTYLWDGPNRQARLYVDGQLVAEQKHDFREPRFPDAALFAHAYPDEARGELWVDGLYVGVKEGE